MKLWPPPSSPRARTAGLALVLLVVSAYGAWRADSIREPPERTPAEITVYGDNPLDVSNGGWAALVAIKVNSCRNPVHVKLTLAGTLELWQHIVAHGDRVHTVVVSALPSPVRNPSIAVADTNVIGAHGTPEPLTRHWRVENGIAADVPHWWMNWEPISVAFDANWVGGRSLGTCYLRLPSLTSYVHAAQGGGSAAAPYYQSITFGQVSLETNDRVDNAAGTRPLTDPHDRIWTCTVNPATPLGHYRDVGSWQGALTLAQFRALPSASSDCGGVAVLERPWNDGVHDLLLLVVGGGIGLGMALLVDVLRRSV